MTTVLITGATKGIGRATAALLLSLATACSSTPAEPSGVLPCWPSSPAARAPLGW